jgi:hypothetical protein
VGFTAGSRGEVQGKGKTVIREEEIIVIIIKFNSILYFNLLNQQLQEPVTESTQKDEIYT